MPLNHIKPGIFSENWIKLRGNTNIHGTIILFPLQKTWFEGPDPSLPAPPPSNSPLSAGAEILRAPQLPSSHGKTMEIPWNGVNGGVHGKIIHNSKTGGKQGRLWILIGPVMDQRISNCKGSGLSGLNKHQIGVDWWLWGFYSPVP